MKKISWYTVNGFALTALMLWNSLGFSESTPINQTAATEAVIATGPKPSPLDFALDLQFIPARYPFYAYTAGDRSQNIGIGARIAWEWLPLANRFGKAGIGGGAAYTKIMKVVLNSGVQSSLETLPLDIYFTYRFDYLADQPLVPFIKTGMERQYARQEAVPGTRRYNGWNWGVGLSILLDRIDRTSAYQLDASTGINNTYLTVEYLNSRPQGSSREINLARDEIRAGLRFEM